METMHVIVFDSTHQAMATESNLLEKKIEVKMIPTPREITLSCGLSLMFSENQVEKVKHIILEEGLNIKGIYRIDKLKKNTKQLMSENPPE